MGPSVQDVVTSGGDWTFLALASAGFGAIAVGAPLAWLWGSAPRMKETLASPRTGMPSMWRVHTSWLQFLTIYGKGGRGSKVRTAFFSPAR